MRPWPGDAAACGRRPPHAAAGRDSARVPGRTPEEAGQGVRGKGLRGNSVREVMDGSGQALVVGGHAGFGTAEAIEDNEAYASPVLLVPEPCLAQPAKVEPP